VRRQLLRVADVTLCHAFSSTDNVKGVQKGTERLPGAFENPHAAGALEFRQTNSSGAPSAFDRADAVAFFVGPVQRRYRNLDHKARQGRRDLAARLPALEHDLGAEGRVAQRQRLGIERDFCFYGPGTK
jgi:hypothetical protein